MAERSITENRPKVKYRVQLQKKIYINKSYSERRNQAIAMRILSYGLFGQKRYQNLYLTCSLNCFYYALKIANAIHRRVPGLAMITKFETAHVIQYYQEQFEGKTYGQKKYSKISIKLTRTPTTEDKNQPGYNAGLSAQSIEEPWTDVMERKQRPEGQERGGGTRGGRHTRGGSRPIRGGFRRSQRGGFRSQGSKNQGFRNQGPRNQGFRNQGPRNQGFRNQGSRNQRPRNQESRNQRPRNQGPRNYRPRNQGPINQGFRGNTEHRGYRDDRQQRDNRQEGRFDNRKFRSNRYEQVQQDTSNRRGERRTRGNNYQKPSQNRNQNDRSDRRANYVPVRDVNDIQDRGSRNPQRKRQSGNSD